MIKTEIRSRMTEIGGQSAEAGKTAASTRRVAVLFERLGPYHHARLNAAGRLMQVFGLEACAMDDTYAWEKVEGAASFTRLTLTERYVPGHSLKKELCRQTWKALNESGPQAVAVPGWSSPEALSALLWCLQTRTPAIMMSESTEWDEHRSSWKEWMKRRLVGLCSAALVGGTAQKDYLVKLGMPAERVFLGYDAVDNRFFENKVAEIRNQKSEIRTKHGLPENFFLASARFVEKKNLPRLLQAYSRYREVASNSELRTSNSEPWRLVLLGDGPLRSAILDLRSSLGLDDCVLLPGFKQYDELPVYCALASAFVHASTTEQWGLVVNEALASGLPVLVSNCCGCAGDLVKDGVNGFTFDPHNVEQLARLMLEIWKLEAGRWKMGEAGREIISHWGPERFAAGLQQAVSTALCIPPPKTSLLDRLLLQALLTR
jgi:glycosyltransferase involved in cell wall biosynthesis